MLTIATAMMSTCAFGEQVGASASTATIRSVHKIIVGHVQRSWLDIAPRVPGASPVPIVVVLAGSSASHDQEIKRDGLHLLADDGKAELIYPAGIGETWNAIGCCGQASAEHVDDLAFMRALVAKVNPNHRRSIDVVGFSNGGRLAYAVACRSPQLFDRYAVVMAMPEPGCIVKQPIAILQLAGTDDDYVPYEPGDTGSEQPPATTEIAVLRIDDQCASSEVTRTFGLLELEAWRHCVGASSVTFATYEGNGHQWPEGDETTPSAASVIWSFINGTPLARPYYPPSPRCTEVWC